jgi:PST family polysaccharide transporter
MFVSVIEKVGFLTMPLVAFLVCVAPELIRLVLGPGWGEAAPVFAWLGLAGMLQPVCSACGWLYITQDRSREYLMWGVYSSCMMVTSFAIGLPWGAVGVAAAYAMTDILVKTPLFWWHVGRRGAVTARDIMKAVWLPLLAALLTIAGFSYCKRLGLELNAVWSGMLVAAGVLCAVHLLVYGAIKDGRRRLSSVYSMGMSAIGKRKQG